MKTWEILKLAETALGERNKHRAVTCLEDLVTSWYQPGYLDGYRAGMNQESPAGDTEETDADGAEVKLHRWYWLEVIGGVNRPIWIRVQVIKAGAKVVVERASESDGSFEVAASRLCSRKPEHSRDSGSDTEETVKLEPFTGMTLMRARELAKATSFGGDPHVGLARFRNVAARLERELSREEKAHGNCADELVEACQKLAAQPTAPRGVLNWLHDGYGASVAASRHQEIGEYRVEPKARSGVRIWVAFIGVEEIQCGTLYKCQAACEALESKQDSPPVVPEQDTDGEEQQDAAKYLDADGNEIEEGALYWIEIVTGPDTMRWHQIKVLRLKQSGVQVRVDSYSVPSLVAESARLHRRHPGEWPEGPEEAKQANAVGLQWANEGGKLVANSRVRKAVSGAALSYSVQERSILWVAKFNGSELHRGGVVACLAACQQHETLEPTA